MSYELSTLERIGVAEEALADFGTDKSGSYTFLDLPFKEGSAKAKLNQKLETPGVAQQYIDDTDAAVLGPRAGELTFSMPLHGSGITADATTAAATKNAAALYMLLHVGFGGSRSNVGSTVASGTSATVFDVAIGDGSNFEAGCAVGLPTGAGGSYEMREVASVVGDTVTLKVALSATPSASDVVLNSLTIYGASNPTTALQFTLQGAEADDQYVLSGGQMTSAPKLTTKLGEIPTIDFTISFAEWYHVSSLGPLSGATYNNYSPVYTFGETILLAASSSVRTVIDAASFDFALQGPKYTPIKSGSGVNTIKQWRRARTAPLAKPSVSLPFQDFTYFTARTNITTYSLYQQIGNAAGEMILISAPLIQLMDVQREDADGIRYQKVDSKTLGDSNATDRSTDLRRAAFRISFA